MDIKEQKVFSVGELTRRVKFLLEDNFEDIWVQGELSNVKVSSRGHTYFSLKDPESIINCVLFSGKRRAMGLKVALQDGLNVAVRGGLSVYKPRGQYQMMADHIDMKGDGALQVAFEKLKSRLLEEGLFERDKKKPLPPMPRHLAVITSSTGAAVRDIIKVARRRNEGLRISVVPVLVQGERAAGEIASAIEAVNEYNSSVSRREEAVPVDVIITGRGGGSLEDLWAFNEEIVARAIYASKVPVVSAVGHETDFTIADMVADLRGATPSSAVESVVPLKKELMNDINRYEKRLSLSLTRRLEEAQLRLDAVSGKYVLRSPMNFINQREQTLDEFLLRAKRAAVKKTDKENTRKDMFESKLHALSPNGVLKRGYSITFRGSKVVSASKELSKGDKLKTMFYEGNAFSVVESAEEK